MPASRDDVVDLVGLIQDAALQPALWQKVLEGLARRIGGVAGDMSIQDPARQTGVPVARFGYDPFYTSQYFGPYLQLNPMFHRRSTLPVGRAVATYTLVSHNDYTKTDFFNDWVRPQGFYDSIGAVVHRQGTQLTWLAAVRPATAGEPTSDDLYVVSRLVPHIVRSVRVMQRLDLLADRQRALQEALTHVVRAVMMIDYRRQLVFANAAAEALLGPGQPLTLTQGRLAAREAGADAALQAALAQALAGPRERVAQELVVPRRGRRPLLLSVVPAGTSVRDHLEPCLHVAAVIIATDPQTRPWSRLDGVVRAYGLTPAEGRVLAAIADGQRLEAVGERLGITRGTAKTHLERIFAKTGTIRQSELVRLVAATVPPL